MIRFSSVILLDYYYVIILLIVALNLQVYWLINSSTDMLRKELKLTPKLNSQWLLHFTSKQDRSWCNIQKSSCFVKKSTFFIHHHRAIWRFPLSGPLNTPSPHNIWHIKCGMSSSPPFNSAGKELNVRRLFFLHLLLSHLLAKQALLLASHYLNACMESITDGF